MDRFGFRHLAVCDEEGGLVGALTSRNLPRQRASAAIMIGDEIESARSVGAASLGHAIWRYAYDVGAHAPDFIKMLSLGAQEWAPPLTWFGGIKTDGDGRVDLKRGGLMPILISARVLSIRHGVLSRATPDRLRGIAATGVGSADEIEGIIDSHGAI